MSARLSGAALCALACSVAAALAGVLSLFGAFEIWRPVIMLAAVGAWICSLIGLWEVRKPVIERDLPAAEQRLERNLDTLLDEMMQLTEEQRWILVERFAAAAERAGISTEQATATFRELGRMLEGRQR